MANLTVNEAILWVAGNGGGVGDAMVPLMNSQRALQDPQLSPELRQMHLSIIDHNMTRVTQAKQQADMERLATDAQFGGAVCDCAPGEPCCMTGGEIVDADDPTRKIVWPAAATNPVTRMYIIGNRMDGHELIGRIYTEIKADPCGLEQPMEQFIAVSNIARGRETVPIERQEQRIVAIGGVPNTTSNLLALFVPDDYIKAAFAVDAIMTGLSLTSEFNGVEYTPFMCMLDDGMGATLEVEALPRVKIDGEATAGIMVQFNPLGGISANATIDGTLKGKIGISEFETKAEGKAETVANSQLQGYSPEGESGMKKMVGSMIQRMGGFVASSTKDGETPTTSVSVGSGVKFDIIFSVGAVGVELLAKSNTPDLMLKLGRVSAGVELKAEGRIDLLEIAVAILLTPAAARTLNSAREEANKSGRAFRGEARCDIVVGAGGKLEHKVNLGGAYELIANGENKYESGDFAETFTGKVSVVGQAIIAIRAEAKIWRAHATAGAAGGIHTSWTWQMRKKGDEQREWRYYFEGVRARAELYATIGISRKSTSRSEGRGGERGGQSNENEIEGLSSSAGSTGTQNVAGYGDPNAADLSKPHPDDMFIVEPTVPKVTVSDPPWQKY